MYENYDLPTFKGDYFAVGYQHAAWWLQYLRRTSGEYYYPYFRRRLNNCWKPRFEPLFQNTLSAYPEVISEIAGMSQALLDSGYKTSPLHVFANCLGETGDRGCQCTAFVSVNRDGPILAHNEEESQVEPLCICRVIITGKSSPAPFLAASYPFQLFGSAFGGVNRHFSFQGNSIGYAKHIRSIEATWQYRLPKTVFTRKWLECRSAKEALSMCSGWLMSLPSHSYFITTGRAYSAEIRPLSTYQDCPIDQLTLRQVHGVHCHTNHFVKNGRPDPDWAWKFNADRHESNARLKFIASCTSCDDGADDIQAIKLISMVAQHQKYRHKTSASFVVASSGNDFTASVSAWFNGCRYTVPLLAP